MLRDIVHTALEDIRYQSWVVLTWRIFAKLVSPLAEVNVQILYDLDLRQPVDLIKARVDCTVERAYEEHIDDILDMQFTRLTSEEQAALSDHQEIAYARMMRVRADVHRKYARQMRLGEECYVARVDGIVAHSNWTRLFGRGTEENCQVDLKPGEIYTTDGHTIERLRGKGLHLEVHTHMLRVAQQNGNHLAFTITDITKAISRRGLRRVGWRRRGAILYLTPRWLGRRFLFRLGGNVEPLFERSTAGA